MTMTRSDSSISYDPDGILDRYAIPFPVFSPDDVRAVFVESTTETPMNNFAVEGFGTEAGVFVRFFTPPPAGKKLVLYRWTKRVQETDYPEGGRFPSKTVEEDFDKLTAMAQEEEDFLQTVVRVPRGAEETPGDYMARFFETAESAMSARNEARDSAAFAAESAAGANAAAEKAAADAKSAVASAAEAAECVSAGAPIGDETQKGIVRLATREEHEEALDGVAAQPAYVKEQLTKYGGLPLLYLIWETSSLDKPGFFRANVNHGLLTRACFPEAAAEVQHRYDAGDTGVVTDADWLTEFAASGMCGKFSIGDGSTTFRIPFFGVNRASLAVAGGDFNAGDFRADQMRAIDSNYSGDITHGPIIGATPFIKMYGLVTEASEANIAELIALTTLLNGQIETLVDAAEITSQILHVQDRKPPGTHGGTFTAGAWRTRALNTVATNTIPGASLANNRITLPPGTYIVEGVAPALQVRQNQTRLYNITTQTEEITGSSVYSGYNPGTTSISILSGVVSFTSDTTLELQHRAYVSVSEQGFGATTTGFGAYELYSQVFIRRIS